ncbi:MAG: hypothetical protein HQK66_03725 [Desulfamplus sp.]|nr:hypothetical protein [Desulfamplus sp.]
MYDFLIGPMLGISIIIFLTGTGYRIFQLFYFSYSAKRDAVPLPRSVTDSFKQREKDEYLLIESPKDTLLKWKLRFQRTLPGKFPVFSLTTIIFHLLLFILPVVTTAHSVLTTEYLGFGLPSLSEPLVDTLTLIFIAIFFYFVLRRILSPKISALTTSWDYLALGITGLPFITGYMAYHQMGHYETLLYIHILSGEIMLMAIPFTKLVHMPFLIFSRFLIRQEAGFTAGKRKWLYG